MTAARSVTSLLVALLGWPLLTSCSRPTWVKAARSGSLSELQSSVERSSREPSFGRRATRELATEILSRELSSADSVQPVTWVDELAPCARALQSQLRQRANKHDTIGGQCAELLIAGSTLAPHEATRYLADGSSTWRAVAARGAVSAELLAARQSALVDPAARVRRAALLAASRAPNQDELARLIELLRGDPEHDNRKLAAVALGAQGTREALLALRDQFPVAAAPLRLAVLDGLGLLARRLPEARNALTDLAQRDSGPLGLRASQLLLEQEPKSPVARSRLLQALRSADDLQQRQALELAQLDQPAELKEVSELASEPNESTAIAAMTRLLELPEGRSQTGERLRVLSQRPNPTGFLARRAMAGARLSSEPLARDLQQSGWAVERREAARMLWSVGDYVSVARALTDDAPEVRTAVACTVLATPE